MLNDVKPPPLNYGMPDPDPSAPLPPKARAVRTDSAGVAPAYEVAPSGRAVHQPTPHRDVLEGHPEMSHHDPASARTPAYLHQQEAGLSSGINHNARVRPEVARGARRGDVSDGGTYSYPTRWSFDSLGLSTVVIIAVVICVLFVVARLFS